jgi:transposase-like protein
MRTSNEQRAAMLALIEQWEQSGMRQKDFYLQHNIPSHVFYYWLKRYQKQKTRPRKAIPATSGFVQLQSSVLSLNNMELHLPNGNRIIFHQQVSVDYLKALIS